MNKTTKRTAIIIGATGVTGKHITRCLLKNDFYSQVLVFSRRKLVYEDDKLLNHVVDFADIDNWSHLIQGDDIFSAMGTTLKQAGSREAQYKVDFGYQADVIRSAADHDVQRLFLISAPNADKNSSIFYSRMKGELDSLVLGLGFETVVLFKPSIIEGDRVDGRMGEKMGGLLFRAVAWMPGLSKWRPISGEQLGVAMVNCATRPMPPGSHCIQLDDIFSLLDAPE